MLRCGMRTTVTIDDALYAQARIRAVEAGSTVGAVLEEAPRTYLSERETAVSADLPPLPTISTGGTRPGVNLDDMSSVYELLDESAGIDAVR